MKVEQKNELLKKASTSYIVIRDEDGEILCMISKEDGEYSAYTLEQYVLLKEDVYKILDKASGIVLIDKIDEGIAEKNKDEGLIKKYMDKTEE